MPAIAMIVLKYAQHFSNLVNILDAMFLIKASAPSNSSFNANLVLTTLGK